MIQLEYDAPTAGTRVSFVVRDGLSSNSGTTTLCQLGKSVNGGKWIAPQNNETLEIVKLLLEKQLQ